MGVTLILLHFQKRLSLNKILLFKMNCLRSIFIQFSVAPRSVFWFKHCQNRFHLLLPLRSQVDTNIYKSLELIWESLITNYESQKDKINLVDNVYDEQFLGFSPVNALLGIYSLKLIPIDETRWLNN